MKTFDVIVSVSHITQIEAETYKEAVFKALEYVADLNIDKPRFDGVYWRLEQVQEARNEQTSGPDCTQENPQQ